MIEVDLEKAIRNGIEFVKNQKGKPNDMWMPGWGWVRICGRPTPEGVAWAKAGCPSEPPDEEE